MPFLRGPEDRLSATGGTIRRGDAHRPATCAAKSSGELRFHAEGRQRRRPSSSSDYKGKVVLLNFWATWCGPCKLEIPEFVEAYSKYRDKGFVILGVLSEDDPVAEGASRRS